MRTMRLPVLFFLLSFARDGTHVKTGVYLARIGEQSPPVRIAKGHAFSADGGLRMCPGLGTAERGLLACDPCQSKRRLEGNPPAPRLSQSWLAPSCGGPPRLR